MPNHTDSKSVQRWVGSLNYLRGFIPRVSEITEPLRLLLKDDANWIWWPNQDDAMTKIKAALICEPLLQYFDASKETTLQVDSSKSGLGAILLQDNHHVAYASRALTTAEQN